MLQEFHNVVDLYDVIVTFRIFFIVILQILYYAKAEHRSIVINFRFSFNVAIQNRRVNPKKT